MSKEIKCKNCNHWNDATNAVCQQCGVSLTETILKKPNEKESNSYQKFVGNLKTQSGWIDRFLDKTKTSNNPFYKGLGYFLQAIWMIYFSILLFIAWLVFLIAG